MKHCLRLSVSRGRRLGAALALALGLAACSGSDSTPLAEGEEPATASQATLDEPPADVPSSLLDLVAAYEDFAREVHARSAAGELTLDQESSWDETQRRLAVEPASIPGRAFTAEASADWGRIDDLAVRAYIQAFDPIVDALDDVEQDPSLAARYDDMAESLAEFELATASNERGLFGRAKDIVSRAKCKLLKKAKVCRWATLLGKKLEKRCRKCDLP